MTDPREHKSHFFRQSGWMMIATVVSGVFMALIHVFSRKISDEEYSVLGTLLQVLNWITIPAIGLQMVIAQQTSAVITGEQRRELIGTVKAVLRWTFYIWLAMVAHRGIFEHDENDCRAEDHQSRRALADAGHRAGHALAARGPGAFAGPAKFPVAGLGGHIQRRGPRGDFRHHCVCVSSAGRRASWWGCSSGWPAWRGSARGKTAIIYANRARPSTGAAGCGAFCR